MIYFGIRKIFIVISCICYILVMIYKFEIYVFNTCLNICVIYFSCFIGVGAKLEAKHISLVQFGHLYGKIIF